jgi:transcriptional regulator GlxA family with amidase domain
LLQRSERTGSSSAGAAPATRPATFVFYLIPNFSMIAFANAVEPLRLANRQLGHAAYAWRFASLSGDSETASSGAAIKTDSSLAEERSRTSGERPDYVFVCTGINVERADTRALKPWLRQLCADKVAVGGLCTAAWVLADTGLLDGKRCAIHWDAIPAFHERFPDVDVHADLYEVSGNIWTCAGGTAALDMVLSIIQHDHGETVATRVCEQCLADRVRHARDRQRLPMRAKLGLQNAKLMFVVELMEANIEEPLSLVELAKYVHLSRRQIERLFRQGVGMSPARYYLEIRLDRARHLLLQSTLPIVDIAVACGFVSASHFSKCFREVYGQSPAETRLARDRSSLCV